MKQKRINKLILASGSPRRKDLLSTLNIPFEVIVSDIDEYIDYNNDLASEIEKLSFQKAKAVFDNHQDSVVIGSDTIVILGDKVLGKPKDYDEARSMLRSLQNNTHKVLTAVTIMSKDNVETFHEIVEVTFNEMDEEEIEEYIKVNEVLDKAGSYAIQGEAAKFIKSVNGDYHAVIGLPLSEVYKRLKKYADVV